MTKETHLPPMPPSKTTATNEWLVPVEQLLYQEAQLLDSQHYKEWLELFTEEGTYWIPTRRGQTDPLNVPSIIYENKDVLSMRVQRLADDNTYLAGPRAYTLHTVNNILIDSIENNEIKVRSSLLVLEFYEGKQRLFGGACTHILCKSANTLKIASKRIDLLDCDGIHAPFFSLL